MSDGIHSHRSKSGGDGWRTGVIESNIFYSCERKKKAGRDAASGNEPSEAWQHVDKRLPILASASAIKLAPLRIKSAAVRTKSTEPVRSSVMVRSTWGRSHRDEMPKSWKTKFQK